MEASAGIVERKGIDQETAQNHERREKAKEAQKSPVRWRHSTTKERAKVARKDMADMAQARVKEKGSRASAGTATEWATQQLSAEAKAKATVPKAEKERIILEQKQAENGLLGTNTAQHGGTNMPERSEM